MPPDSRAMGTEGREQQEYAIAWFMSTEGVINWKAWMERRDWFDTLFDIRTLPGPPK